MVAGGGFFSIATTNLYNKGRIEDSQFKNLILTLIIEVGTFEKI